MGLCDERALEERDGDPEARKGEQQRKEFADKRSQREKEEEEEEELVDPLTTIREQCEKTEKCVKFREILEACDARVSSRSHTEEQCTEELFDFLHARDHCVAHKLFSKLK